MAPNEWLALLLIYIKLLSKEVGCCPKLVDSSVTCFGLVVGGVSSPITRIPLFEKKKKKNHFDKCGVDISANIQELYIPLCMG